MNKAIALFKTGTLAIDPRISQFMLRERLVDLSTPAAIRKWKMAQYSLKDYAELFFVNFTDPDEHFHAYKGQDRIFTFMQKGRTRGSILKSSRGTGKSYGCSAAAAALICTRPCSCVMIGQNVKRAKDLMRKAKHFIKMSPMGAYLNKREDSVFRFALNTPMAFMETAPAAEGALGGHYNYGLIDEIARISSEVWWQTIYPMFRRVGRKWIAISTPKLQQGVFWQLWKKSAFTHDLIANPGLARFKPFTRLEITIDDQDWLVDRVKEWNQESGTNLTLKEYLELQRELMGEMDFRQEILGEFLPLGTNVFPEQFVDRSMRIGQTDMYLSSWERKFSNTFTGLGFDLGKYHSRSVVCVGHRDKKNIIHCDYIRIFPIGLAYIDIIYNPEHKKPANRCYIDIIKNFKPHFSAIDSTGLGDPVFEIIQQQHQVNNLLFTRLLNNKKNRHGFIFDMNTKPAAIDEVVKLLEKDMIRLPYHNNAIGRNDPGWVASEMKKEMLAYSYDVGERNIKYHGEGETDDIVIALALMCWSLRKKPYTYARSKLA